MAGFQIQQQSIGADIWVVPTVEPWWREAGELRSSSIDTLRQTIDRAADKWPFSFSRDVRIVSDRGDAVERYRVRMGSARRLRRSH